MEIFKKNTKLFCTDRHLKEKFQQIFFNTAKLNKFQRLSSEISKMKIIYFFIFKNLFIFLKNLERTMNFFKILNSFYEISTFVISYKKIIFLKNCIKLRKRSISFFQKKKIICKKKSLEIKHTKTDFYFISDFILKSRKILKILQNYKLYWLVFLMKVKLKKMEIQEFKRNLMICAFMDEILNFLKKTKDFEKLTLFRNFLKNLKFCLIIGIKNLDQIIIENYAKLILFPNYSIHNFFGFLRFEMNLVGNRTMKFLNEPYVFWKKINHHPLFLCPVEKVCKNQQIIVLPCGHIFSFETVKKLSEIITKKVEFRNSVNKIYLIQTMDCPWCESVQEIIFSNKLILGIHFLSNF